MALERRIAIKGDPIVDESLTIAAGQTIRPGHLIDLDGSGDAIVHAGAALSAVPRFALARGEKGQDTTDAYTAGDTLKAGTFAPGSRVNARVAAGVTVTRGNFVESAGDGTVRDVATDAATDNTQRRSVLGQARETVTAPGGAEAFIDIEIV